MGSGGHNRLTKEKVIEQFIEVHGYDFDYSNMVYINTHTPIEVRCKKHDFVFFPTPRKQKRLKNHKKSLFQKLQRGMEMYTILVYLNI